MPGPNFALGSAPYNQSNSAYKRETRLVVVLTSNGTTVSIATARSAPGFTVTTGANGAITGTMPKSARGVVFSQRVTAVAATEGVVDVSAFSPTAGTFALQNHNAAAETILASGDEIFLYFILEGG